MVTYVHLTSNEIFVIVVAIECAELPNFNDGLYCKILGHKNPFFRLIILLKQNFKVDLQSYCLTYVEEANIFTIQPLLRK